MVRKSPGMSRDGPSSCPIQELVVWGVGNNTISDINGSMRSLFVFFFQYSNKWTHPGFFFGGVGYIYIYIIGRFSNLREWNKQRPFLFVWGGV